jgi:hexosaminidase
MGYSVARTITQLRTDNMQRLVVGGGATDVAKFTHASNLHTLTLSLTSKSALSIAQNAQLPLSSRVESYSLHVPSDGSVATLSANTSLGLFRGLTTFTQLWYTYQRTIYTISAPIYIFDKPAYVRPNEPFCHRYLFEISLSPVSSALPWIFA